MNNLQKNKLLTVVAVVCFLLLFSAIWVSSWYLAWKLFGTAALVAATASIVAEELKK